MLPEARGIASALITSAAETQSQDHDMHLGPSLTLGAQSKYSKNGAASVSSSTYKPSVWGGPTTTGQAPLSSVAHTDTRNSKFRSFHLGTKPNPSLAKPPEASGRPPLDTRECQEAVGGLMEDEGADDEDNDEDYVDVHFVMHAGFPELPRAVPLTFTLTMYACLSRVPEERPTFSQILTLFKDLDDELSSGNYVNSLGQPEVCLCLFFRSQ